MYNCGYSGIFIMTNLINTMRNVYLPDYKCIDSQLYRHVKGNIWELLPYSRECKEM